MQTKASHNPKSLRQRKLLRLIRRKPAANQAELVVALHAEGLDATQASVSRDLRELGVVKVSGRYVPADRVLGRAKEAALIQQPELITSVEPVGGNLVIVRTEIGAASRVAAQIDARPQSDVAATLAGDDTVFIAVRSRAAQGRVLSRLRRPTLA